MNNWTSDIEKVLEEIRMNAVQLSNNHKQNYFFYKSLHKYFRIPTIILSSVASVSAVGLQNYISQSHINGIVCLLGLSVSVVNSIELFLKLQETLEMELNCSKEFYNLSIDIRKTLLLDRENRQLSGQTYLEKRYNDYVKLQEQSNLISNSFNDGLNNLPKKISMMKKLMPPKKKNSNSSSSSTASPMTEDEEQIDREL
jgi:hypothetical protein